MARRKSPRQRAQAGSVGRLLLDDPELQVRRGDPEWRIKYETYMSSEAWRKTKARYLAAHRKPGCAACGRREDIALHHRTYDRLGSELFGDLVPVCPTCHQGIHDLHRTRNCSLEEATDLVLKSNRRMGEAVTRPEPPEFVPANQRGATRLPGGRLKSSLDWRDEVRSLRGLTNNWHQDD